MDLIDTHAHLASPDFDADRGAVLQRAREGGVLWVLCATESLAEFGRALELAEEHAMLRVAAGIHPDRVVGADPEDLREELRALAELARRRRDDLVAIGEVGLDYWRAKEAPERALQRELLGSFVDLARELELPLSVHSRSAGRHTIELLTARGARQVVMHAFDGRAAAAQPGLDAGFWFSVPASVVRSRQKQKLVRRLPLERLLLETDSPVLGAEPGKRNEPAAALVAAQEVARLQKRSLEEVVAQTTRNAEAVFGVPVAR